MGFNQYSAWCVLCGGKLIKFGTTSAGKQRWRCKECGVTGLNENTRARRNHELELFLKWLLGKSSQSEISGATSRTFRNKTSWCWNISPTLQATPARFVMVDGIYIGKKVRGNTWCCLIAMDAATLRPLAFQWCDREKTIAWE
ncbi:MAG: IS256 family transposase, partial [Micrococcaceae bacterium]